MQSKKLISINEDKTNKDEENKKKGFHMRDIKPSENCCNSNSYGVICIKCGRCGRRFL